MISRGWLNCCAPKVLALSALTIATGAAYAQRSNEDAVAEASTPSVRQSGGK